MWQPVHVHLTFFKQEVAKGTVQHRRFTNPFIWLEDAFRFHLFWEICQSPKINISPVPKKENPAVCLVLGSVIWVVNHLSIFSQTALWSLACFGACT